FVQGYRGTGWREGARFGIWVTLLAGVPPVLANAAMLPEGRKLPLHFLAVDLLTFVVCGVVAARLAGGGSAQAARV
ncbi:MAG: hypothetical protein ACRD1E_00370, partial [Terriglobales bacterium]